MINVCILNNPINIIIRDCVIHPLGESGGEREKNFVVKLVGIINDLQDGEIDRYRFVTMYYFYKNRMYCSEVNYFTDSLFEFSRNKYQTLKYIGNNTLNPSMIFGNCYNKNVDIDFDNFKNKDLIFEKLYKEKEYVHFNKL